MILSRLVLATALLPLTVSAVVPSATAADHKDAPYVAERPPADINDVYVFKRNGKLVVAMTINPVSDPDFNGTYHFSPDALYRFAFDVNRDGATDRTIDVTFGPVLKGVQTLTARFPDGTTVTGKTTPPTTLSDFPPAPVVNTGPGGISIFAGQRDDPFYFDLVGFNRFVAAHAARAGQSVSDAEARQFRGEDSFAGLNTSVIVIEAPIGVASGGSTRFGFSGFTYLRADAARSAQGTPTVTMGGVTYEQFDRMGNPAVNTVFIPSALKDQFNRSLPQNDARDYAGTVVATLQAFNTPPANVQVLASVALPDTIKYDFGGVQRYPNGRQPQEDVVDTLLSLVVGKTVADGVNRNDLGFQNKFPYFARPHQPLGD